MRKFGYANSADLPMLRLPNKFVIILVILGIVDQSVNVESHSHSDVQNFYTPPDAEVFKPKR